MSISAKKNSKNNARTGALLIPQDETSQHILQERAIHLAKPIIMETRNQDATTYVCFKLGSNERYGITYQYVKEIIHGAVPTPVPCAPDFINGIINLRGTLLAVLDLKRFFHVQTTEISKNVYIIIVEDHPITMGILVDDIEGRSVYDTWQLDTSPTAEGIIKPEYIVGLHNGMTAIINIHAILTDLIQ